MKNSLDRILEEMNLSGERGLDVRKREIAELERDLENSGSPVIKILNSIILEGIRASASDIHMEPYEDYMRVRYRIDGVLKEIKRLPKGLAGGIFSRLKVMSDLDIAEKRMPQDGRFKSHIEGRDIDFRVSIIPTMFGEKGVLRILDRKNFSSALEELGFSKGNYERIARCIGKSYGMILIVGPTGSGKTTTLYSMISRLNREGVNILTAEDPIEYEIEGINQVQCRSEIGLGFSNILRNFLRQDPDIIMVGEIRDHETGEIALKASLTGHLLVSTLHTQDVFTAMGRMINLGLEPHLIASCLTLIMSQRLARKLCPNCKAEDPDSLRKLAELGEDGNRYGGHRFYRAKGCEMCNGGYRGRIAFEEVLEIDERIKEMIEGKATGGEYLKYAQEMGMRSLKERGIERALEGETSLDEIIRVC